MRRRQLIQAGLAAAALLPFRRARAADCDWCGAADAPPGTGPATILAPASEPGERMVIRGSIFAADGKTPVNGALLYVWQADARGIYPTHPKGHKHGRLRGWARTGPDGRYEIRSIRPASYPNSTVPQHIHATLSAPGVAEHLVDEYWFEGDPHVSEAARKQVLARDPGAIVKLTREGGVWRGRRDLTLRP